MRALAYCSRVHSWTGDLNSDLIESGRQTSCAPCGTGQPQTVVVLVSTFHRMWNRPRRRSGAFRFFTGRGGHFLRRRLSDKFRISSGVVTVARCLLSSFTETGEDPPLWNNRFPISSVTSRVFQQEYLPVILWLYDLFRNKKPVLQPSHLLS